MFKLKNNTEISVEWNLGVVMKLDKVDFTQYTEYEGDFSFLKPPEQFFTQWIKDTGFIAALCYYSLSPEKIEEVGSEDDFVAQLHGPAISAMKETMWDTIADFFQDPRINFLVSEMKRQTKVVREKIEGVKATLQNLEDEHLNQALEMTMKTLETQAREKSILLQQSLESRQQS